MDALLDAICTADYSADDRKQAHYRDLQKEFTQVAAQSCRSSQHQNGWYLGEKVGGFPGAIPSATEPDVRELWIAQ